MSTKQPNLFGESGIDAYGAPLSRRTDPPTSSEAAARHIASGKLGHHAEIALALVQRHPGSTYVELWTLATGEEKEALGDQVELMRRLSGLKGSGKVRQGEVRACTIKGSRMVVWEPV